MAEAAASALVKVIFDKLADDAFKKYVRAQGIHTELENLGRELSRIQAVLHDASDKEIKDESVKQWLNDLQHLAYDIDDVLDDVATEAMHRELTQYSSGGSTSMVRKLIPTCCNNLSLSHRLHHKLDSITVELEHLYKAKSDLGLIVKDEQQRNTNRGNETSLLESDIVGREDEKEKLIKKLLGEDQSSKGNFSILPIVGMGGVGKTTLARLLYNDMQVKDHFELHAWICVSDDFDISKISKTIFQVVSGENTGFEDLNRLQMALKEKLKDKRFLIVLDDVWNESYDDWEKLVRPFHFGAPGSKIIMTTRKDQLLKKLGFDRLDDLESLSDKHAMSLLSIHALAANNFDSHPTLREKGEGIVEKCGGLPLALKAIGRLLRTKSNGEDWDAVLKSDIWDLESADEIVPALKLSYHDLSADLKWLFAYCSLFPKDFLFDKEELVLLWMAEGYLIQSDANKSQERLGDESFEKLLSRSFFQHAPNNESLFVMHDLMNDLAKFVAEDYFLRFDYHVDARKKTLAKYRHMSFIREEYAAYHKFEIVKIAKSLRTFLVVNDGVDKGWKKYYLSNKILVDLLPEFPMLRVLSLSHFEIHEVPEFIGSLKHLRYLNLSKTKIKELPEFVCNLYNLHTIIIFGCKRLTKLPKSFLKLKKLRHLDIRDTPELEKLPLGIGELKSLQTLSKFVIGGDCGFAITELNGLNDLHGELYIKGLCEVQNTKHAQEAKLSLKGFTTLVLNWGDGCQHGTLGKELLHELKPDSGRLKKLVVMSYGGVEFPNWVGDPSFLELVHVSIHGCRRCASLPPFGQLPSLKELFIQGMDEVKAIGLEFTGTTSVAFPSLKILEFYDMPRWKVWSNKSEALDALFPCLKKLYIKKCPKLIEISLETLPSVEFLMFRDMWEWEVWATNSEALDAMFPCLRELHIMYCPKLIDVAIKALPSLEFLMFHDMWGWEVWSTKNKVLDVVFPRLRELHMVNCPKLIDVSLEAMPSLRVLKIYECGAGVLRSVVKAASSITKLVINSITGLTDEVWRDIIKYLGVVEEVSIGRCNELKFLWESEAEASKFLVNLKKLEILRCDDLVSLGEKEEEDNFGSSLLSSLIMLQVSYCESMERCTIPNNISIVSLCINSCSSVTRFSFPTTQGGGQKLKSLSIKGCNKLMEKINTTKNANA